MINRTEKQKDLPKQKDRSRTEQRCVGITAIKSVRQILVLTCSLGVETLHTLFAISVTLL